MNVQPIRDFILVEKPVEKEEKVGLIYKPSTVENKICKAKVLAVGSGQVTANGSPIAMEVKVGDYVIFNRNFGVELTEEGETAILLREEHVMCIAR